MQILEKISKVLETLNFVRNGLPPLVRDDFMKNWVKLFSIFGEKIDLGPIRNKICTVQMTGKELRKFSSISYTFAQGEGNRYALTRGKIFVSRNAKWCLILLFWLELTLIGLNLTIKHLLVVLQ